MKKSLFLLLLTLLAITACQNDKAPTSKAPTTTTTATSASSALKAVSTQSQLAGEQHQALTLAANDTVAVTKPAESHAAQSLNTAMRAAGDQIKGKLEAMQSASVASNQPEAAKAVSAQALADHSTPAAPSGDIVKGKTLAKKCALCHYFTAKKKVGPGLKGIMGRKTGIMAGMKYSSALAAGGWVWSEKNIAMWVCDSKKAVKVLSGNPSAKTKMSPQRICDPQKQADLIAFLKTL
ncbi:MAG: c-type cytochrome [Mariprofundus sp.]|nr:c-type cytochrome [Mariprofundus sp.]